MDEYNYENDHSDLITLELREVPLDNGMDHFRTPNPIPRQTDSGRITKRTTRPGPPPKKPDEKCTPEEILRRERRRLSNRKAAQNARDRRQAKQNELEGKNKSLMEENNILKAEKKAWEIEKTELNTRIRTLEDKLDSFNKQETEALNPLNLLNFNYNGADEETMNLTDEQTRDILDLKSFEAKTCDLSQPMKSHQSAFSLL